MTDTPGLGRPQQDDDQLRHTLTIHDVSEQLATAGVPRSERQIKRYCESGFLDAKKIPGPTGDQWFVAPAALPRLIGDLQQWQMQRQGHSETRPAKAGRVRICFYGFFWNDTLRHGRPCLSVSRTLHLPLLQIADQSWKRGGRDEPLIAGRARNFFGVEKSAFTVAFDLSFRSRHANGGELLADIMDCQSVTKLVIVLLWPAKAGRVIH